MIVGHEAAHAQSAGQTVTRCQALSAAGLIRLVQLDTSFQIALHGIRRRFYANGSPPWQEVVNRFCWTMRDAPVLGHISLVYFTAGEGIETLVVKFLVADARVTLVNQLEEDQLRASIDTAAWSTTLKASNSDILTPTQALSYGCLLASLYANTFPEDACRGEGDVRMSRLRDDGWHVSLKTLDTDILIGRRGEIVGLGPGRARE
jgi:hypothetical protein